MRNKGDKVFVKRVRDTDWAVYEPPQETVKITKVDTEFWDYKATFSDGNEWGFDEKDIVE